MTAIAHSNAEAPTAATAGASRGSVPVNTPDHITDARSMSTNASSPLSPAEAARLARGLSALQNWLLRRIGAAGGSWNSLESPFAELDGGGQAVAALKRRGLIRTEAFYKILTPAGVQVAALLPPLDERVRVDSAYMRILQNAHFLHAHADAEGWLTVALLTNNVRGRSRYGLLAALVTLGYLERGERGRVYRLTEQGRAFRARLFVPSEIEALIYFARFSLANPEAYIPRPAGRNTRVATNRAFDLQRPPVIGKATIAALVRRDLLEAAPNGLDAYRATHLSRPLLAMRAPAEPETPVGPQPEPDEQDDWEEIAAIDEERRRAWHEQWYDAQAPYL